MKGARAATARLRRERNRACETRVNERRFLVLWKIGAQSEHGQGGRCPRALARHRNLVRRQAPLYQRAAGIAAQQLVQDEANVLRAEVEILNTAESP